MVIATLPALDPVSLTVTQSQVDFFRQNGYLVVEDILSADELEALLQETVHIFRVQRGTVTV